MVLWYWRLKAPTSPKDPSFCPPKLPPLACATSSTTFRPCLRAIAMIRSILAGIPRMCTGIKALVRLVILRSRSSGSMVREPSTSQTIGRALAATTAAQVAKKVYEGTITSSPGSTPTATRPLIRAEVHELTARQCLTPR